MTLPDPSTLTTWEDAFTHPLPVVRKLEKQLRQNIDENRTKLRSLVGTSYRELLGTAERIIEMDEQIQQAEVYMGEIGRKCNSGIVERIVENHARVKRGKGKEGRVAQMKVLQSAIAVSGRIVKSGGDALLAAKLVVLARLLFKSLDDGTLGMEEMRRKLGLARKRLLSYIARSLVKTQIPREEETSKTDGEETVKTLCAYSLITSSSPKDVLRYFLQLRFEQLETKAETPSEDTVLEMLDLYSRTLLETKDLFPRRFAETLSQLSRTALIKDADVRGVYQLSLDIYEQWIAEDVRNFHPWVRHDQLSSSEVGAAMASWSKQAQKCLLQGLRDTLKEQHDAPAVLGLRRNVLTKYLSLSAKLQSVGGHAQAISDIRAAFLDRLENLASQAAGTLKLGFDARQSDADPHSSGTWDLAASDMDMSNGAMSFRKAVIRKQHGRDEVVERAIKSMDDWVGHLGELTEVLSTMRSAKWDDDLDLDLDDLDEGESLQAALNKDDPTQLEAKLNQETTAALQRVYKEVENSPESDTHPTVLIRILREIDRRRRSLADKLDKDKTVGMDSTFVENLHSKVATTVSERSIAKFVSKSHAHKHVPISLWDGTPALPVQPSVATFRFIKDLHGDMSNAGNDLWSPDAINCLKRTVVEKLGEQLNLDWADQQKPVALSNGHTDTEEAVDGQQGKSEEAESDAREVNGNGEASADATTNARLVQYLFDLLYLQRVLSTAKQDRLNELAHDIKQRVDLDTSSVDRLRKSSNDYWKRTYLLFGLLATGYS